jgi:hypothetical protein
MNDGAQQTFAVSNTSGVLNLAPDADVERTGPQSTRDDHTRSHQTRRYRLNVSTTTGRIDHLINRDDHKVDLRKQPVRADSIAIDPVTVLPQAFPGQWLIHFVGRQRAVGSRRLC